MAKGTSSLGQKIMDRKHAVAALHRTVARKVKTVCPVLQKRYNNAHFWAVGAGSPEGAMEAYEAAVAAVKAAPIFDGWECA